jgi:hypothetical protein
MRRNGRFAAVLGAFVLLAAMTAGAQKAVTRPWTMAAESQQVISLSDGAISAHAWGQASHLGQFTSEGSGHVGNPFSRGTMTAANGDLVYFEGGVNGVYTVTAGTGRFVGATGTFVVTPQMVGELVMHPDGTATIDLSWTAVGTIRY